MSAVIAERTLRDRRLTPGQVPPTVVERLEGGERTALAARIARLLVERDATLVAHYYTSPELQELAEATGADCVQVIGSKFVLYLQKKKDSAYAALLK